MMDGDDNNGGDELKTFLKIWTQATASLIYCYYVATRIPQGIQRLLSVLPVIYLLATLPLQLTTFHLGGPTTFYFLWLGTFKLALFAFGSPPLSEKLSLSNFVCVGLLPISPRVSKSERRRDDVRAPFLVPVKVIVFVSIICAYEFRERLHPVFILALYACHAYLGLELFLAMTAALVRPILDFEVERQFNEPYLATSLQDFWGRRWNLMVPTVLRPTVYNPVRNIFVGLIGKNCARIPATFASFLVSGLMHELIYFYLTRVEPTWEVTWFFVLQGVCTAMEVVIKAVVGERWRLSRWVSGPLTLGFIAVTGAWLFLPQLLRNEVDLKTIKEYSSLLRYVQHKLPLLN